MNDQLTCSTTSLLMRSSSGFSILWSTSLLMYSCRCLTVHQTCLGEASKHLLTCWLIRQHHDWCRCGRHYLSIALRHPFRVLRASCILSWFGSVLLETRRTSGHGAYLSRQWRGKLLYQVYRLVLASLLYKFVEDLVGRFLHHGTHLLHCFRIKPGLQHRPVEQGTVLA